MVKLHEKIEKKHKEVTKQVTIQFLKKLGVHENTEGDFDVEQLLSYFFKNKEKHYK